MDLKSPLSKDEGNASSLSETMIENNNPSLDNIPLPLTENDPEKGIATVMLSGHLQQSIQFTAGDTGNPRNWSPKKKFAIAFLALLSTFVA